MSNVAGRRDGMVEWRRTEPRAMYLKSKKRKAKKKKKVKQTRLSTTDESIVDYVYYKKNPWPVENSYSPNLDVT